MVSKPKTAKVRKVQKAIPEPPKSDKQPDRSGPVDTAAAEQLAIKNGELIEQLFQSEAWTDIVKPLLDESIAGVSGRFTNGRYWHGTLTQKWDGNTSLAMAFYQKSLMEFHNHLHDFIVEKNRLLAAQKRLKAAETEQVVNTFLESDQ